jgi:hypothetical protein
MLHGRRVKAMPHESALGGFDDADAPVRLGPRLKSSLLRKNHGAPENERSFSGKTGLWPAKGGELNGQRSSSSVLFAEEAADRSRDPRMRVSSDHLDVLGAAFEDVA